MTNKLGCSVFHQLTSESSFDAAYLSGVWNHALKSWCRYRTTQWQPWRVSDHVPVIARHGPCRSRCSCAFGRRCQSDRMPPARGEGGNTAEPASAGRMAMMMSARPDRRPVQRMCGMSEELAVAIAVAAHGKWKTRRRRRARWKGPGTRI